MPAKSSKQYNLAQAVKHGGALKSAMPMDVAEEMIEKTPHKTRSRFAKMMMKKRKK